jgi:electron transfer flavoprotein alpha subunit
MSAGTTGLTLLIADWHGSELHPATRDAAVLARRLGNDHVMSVVFGPAPDAVTTELAMLVSKIHLAVGPNPLWQVEAACHACDEMIRRLQPEWVVFPATGYGYDLAPRLAARWHHSLIANCSAVEIGEEGPLFTRSVHQGRLQARVRPAGNGPHFVTVEPGAGSAMPDRPAQVDTVIEQIHFDSLPGSTAMPQDEPVMPQARSSALRDAGVVVAVGRGIRSREGVEHAARLAEILGAELAASRPVCDEGWLPADRQIGSSGVTVAPRLYIALGVSGAIQHTIGMLRSRHIIAINRDPNAPIHRIADVAVIGDLGEILPELISKLEQASPV